MSRKVDPVARIVGLYKGLTPEERRVFHHVIALTETPGSPEPRLAKRGRPVGAKTRATNDLPQAAPAMPDARNAATQAGL
jgi:hypothetical protein